jgi:ATP-dependent Clp protease protease subunit
MIINHEFSPLLKSRSIDDALEDVPITIRVTEFTEKGVKSFSEEFCKAVQTGQSVIPIEIDSYGGQVYSLLSMIDIIKSSTIPVATIVTGKAMSCGAVLFTCGTEGMRYMQPNSTLMIHDVGSISSGKIEELKSDVAESDRLNELVYTTMARNVGKDDKYFSSIVHEKGHADWFITPSEALKHNLANKIACPKFNVRISVDISFG